MVKVDAEPMMPSLNDQEKNSNFSVEKDMRGKILDVNWDREERVLQ